MSETKQLSKTPRTFLFVTIGAALVTSWLEFFYEEFVARGVVITPQWWSLLQIVSVLVLFIFAVVLAKRDRKLCIFAWFTFVICVVPLVIPGYA